MKAFSPIAQKPMQGTKKSIFFLWIRLLSENKLYACFTLSAGLLAIVPSAMLVLLVTYAVTFLQGSPRVYTWSELVGEHASRWIGPFVRNTSFESGFSVEFQKSFIIPALLAAGLLGSLFKTLNEFGIEDLSEKITQRLRSHVSETFLDSSYSIAKNTSAAMIANFFGDDIREIRLCFTRICGSIPIELISAFTYLFLLAILDTQLFVLFFVIFLPAGVVVRGTGKYLRTLAKSGVYLQTELTQSFLEKMNGWQTIQTFSSRDNELGRFEQKNKTIFDVWRRSARAKALSSPSVEWLGVIALASVLILALRRVSEGALPSIILTAFIFTIAQLSNSLQTVVNQLNTTKKGSAALRRLFDFFEELSASTENRDTNNQSKSPKQIKAERVQQFEIYLEDVSLSHPAHDQKFLFRELTLQLVPGDMLAIRGPSGAGKSTLLECITGLKSVNSGRIILKKNDCILIENPILAHCLSVTYLSQEPFVFDAPISENVTYPEKYNRLSLHQIERVKEALKSACLGHKNPEDSAQGLSGGEKQRLAFARGFFSRPQLWIIDEGTSALDTNTEAQLMLNLAENSKDSIKIVVAHRPILQSFSTKNMYIDPHQEE